LFAKLRNIYKSRKDFDVNKLTLAAPPPAAGDSARREKKVPFFHVPFRLTPSISFLNVSNIRARTVLHPTDVLLIFALTEYKRISKPNVQQR